MANDMAGVVARLTAALDGVPDTERVCVTDEWNRVVLFVSETPGKLRDIYVRDLREVLAAYADAARDRERMDWLESSNEYAIGHPAFVGDSWWLFFNDAARDVEAPTLRAAIDAARTGEAR